MKAYSTKQFDGLTKDQLRDQVHAFYQESIQGRTVVNQQKGITILFNSKGRKKTAKQYVTKPKALVIFDLVHALRVAVFNNWGEPKPQHIQEHDAIGFLNFKYTCLVDGKRMSFRIAVMLTRTGKFQYDLHEDNLPRQQPKSVNAPKKMKG